MVHHYTVNSQHEYVAPCGAQGCRSLSSDWTMVDCPDCRRTRPVTAPTRPCGRPGCDQTLLADSGYLFCSLACEEATPESTEDVPIQQLRVTPELSAKVPTGSRLDASSSEDTGLSSSDADSTSAAFLPPPEPTYPVEGCHGDA